MRVLSLVRALSIFLFSASSVRSLARPGFYGIPQFAEFIDACHENTKRCCQEITADWWQAKRQEDPSLPIDPPVFSRVNRVRERVGHNPPRIIFGCFDDRPPPLPAGEVQMLQPYAMECLEGYPKVENDPSAPVMIILIGRSGTEPESTYQINPTIGSCEPKPDEVIRIEVEAPGVQDPDNGDKFYQRFSISRHFWADGEGKAVSYPFDKAYITLTDKWWPRNQLAMNGLTHCLDLSSQYKT